MVEQCLDLLGEWPVSVFAQLQSHLWATEVEDYFFLRLAFPSGPLATLEASSSARIPQPRWFAVGSEGTLTGGAGFGHWSEMRLQRAEDETPVDLPPQALPPNVEGRGMDAWLLPVACFYDDLAEALGRGQPPAVTAARARDVMAILDAARRSHETGQVVAPPEAKDT